MSLESTSNSRKQRLAFAAACALIVLAVICAYFPGLSGPFMLDDYGSIAALANHGGIVDWESFKAFVLGGQSGPTGRPVALLTFLLDATDWPTEAGPFKRTNLIIHLLNGALLAILIRQVLGALSFNSVDTRRVVFVSTAIWLLHPFLVSTTLYAVQRMAQLATFFMLAGLVTYLGSRRLLATDCRKAYWLMSLSLPLFTLLAVLSKENGILLPVLVGVVEITLFSGNSIHRVALNRYWSGLFIVAPSAVVFLYLTRQFFLPDFFNIVPPRDFSLYERMLTESRVLAEYLQNWFIPKLYTTGVFQDHVIKSTGVLSPISTLFAIVLHVGAITLAFAMRRKLRLFALAILFFYAGHLLESTVLNLELYFEHRNYLPAALLFVPIVAALNRHLSARNFYIFAAFTILLLGSFTRYSATIWQSVPSIVEASANKAPTSARAQAQYANLLFNANQQERALKVIDDAIENIPHNNSLLHVNRLIILCNTNSLDSLELKSVGDQLSRLPYDSRLTKAYNEFAKGLAEGRCPNNSVSSALPMFVAMLDVEENKDPTSLAHSHIRFLIGYVKMYSGDPVGAMQAYKRSLVAQPGASHAMAMAALMASSNFSHEALELSQQAMEFLREEQETMVIGTRVSEDDILEFQETVRAQVNEQREIDNTDVNQ